MTKLLDTSNSIVTFPEQLVLTEQLEMLTEQLSSAGVKRFFSMAVWRCLEWNLLQPPILHRPQESLRGQGCPMCEIARQRIQLLVDLIN